MKPLPAVPVTSEDWAVWLAIRADGHGEQWLLLIDHYESADRRDAELMLIAQTNRQFAWFVRGESDEPVVFCRGWDWLRKRLELERMGVPL